MVDEVKEKYRPVYKRERVAVQDYKWKTNKLDIGEEGQTGHSTRGHSYE